jgi:radical SAM protein with 4Fe4S-binding SPASM domain
MMGDDLTTSEAKSLIEDISSLAPGWVILEGGETFLRDDIFELIELMKGREIDVHAITNGLLLDEGMIKELATLKVKVLFSIDGADKRTYERAKGGACWETMLKNARLAKQAGVLNGVTTVFSRANKDQLGKLVGLTESLGAKVLVIIGIEPFSPWEEFSAIAPGPEEYRAAVEEVASLMRTSKVQIFFDEPFWGALVKENEWGGGWPSGKSGIVVAERQGCIFGEYLYIQTNGDVRPCMFSPKSLTFGNVREKSLSKIWREMRESTLLRDIRKAALRKGACASCKYFDECRGCASRIFAYGGDYFLSDPACPLGQAAAKTV